MLPKLDPIGLAGMHEYLVSLLYLENNQATYTSHFKRLIPYFDSKLLKELGRSNKTHIIPYYR